MFAASAVGATLHPGRAPGHNDRKPKPLVFGVGYGLAAAVVWGNVWGLSDWFLD